MNRVYLGGTFDILHPGHLYLLSQARKITGRRGRVVVSLNTDEFVVEYKGRPPVFDYEERKECLYACKYVDLVVENTGGADSKPAILRVDPDIIAVGEDWARKDYYKQMDFTQKWLIENNIVLVYLSHLKGISSSEIKERVKNAS